MHVHERLPPALSELFNNSEYDVDDSATLRWLLRGVDKVGIDEVIAECLRMMSGQPEQYDGDWRKSTGSSW